jgi:hypothetical protein
LSMERKRSSLSTRRNSASTSNGAIAPEVPTALAHGVEELQAGVQDKVSRFLGLGRLDHL